jgi:hypothetical protein
VYCFIGQVYWETNYQYVGYFFWQKTNLWRVYCLGTKYQYIRLIKFLARLQYVYASVMSNSFLVMTISNVPLSFMHYLHNVNLSPECICLPVFYVFMWYCYVLEMRYNYWLLQTLKLWSADISWLWNLSFCLDQPTVSTRGMEVLCNLRILMHHLVKK